MVKRWLLYLAVLLGLIIFYVAYRGWMAWMLLLIAITLPLFSLVMSLPLMLAVQPSLTCSGLVTMGQKEPLSLSVRTRLPLPPTRCEFRLTHSLTGQQYTLLPDQFLPTDHCGALDCRSQGYYVYDFLGLFRMNRHRMPPKQILIRPKAVQWDHFEDLDRRLARSWRPKYGGGFAENHELRLYRPGDGLNQVHWKLSAKTGKLIIREPMVPQVGKILLTLDIAGTPEELDRKLGRLLWMGQRLLERGLRWELHALTGEGLLTFYIHTDIDLTDALDRLLCATPATGGSLRYEQGVATWRCHIGGTPDED